MQENLIAIRVFEFKFIKENFDVMHKDRIILDRVCDITVPNFFSLVGS